MKREDMIEKAAIALDNLESDCTGWQNRREGWKNVCRSKAEVVLDAFLNELPDWHSLHKDDKSKSIINTMAAMGVTYQKLLNMREKS